MDKTEYRMKLDEIGRLVEAGDFQGALQVTETIDWRRVKSIRTLCTVADIYEANGKLKESKDILLLAYNRASVGKSILYRLVELSLKLGEFDEAVDYYSDFVDCAPNDNSRYLLKYKIYKAKRSPLSDQIAILEEYKNREYTERWAYELARLYAKAGQKDKCIEICDDLILWFSEGKYVYKAMELKMSYVPLTQSQQAVYQQRFQYMQEEKEQKAKERQMLNRQREARRRQAEENIAAATAAATAETVDAAGNADVGTVNPAELQQKLNQSIRDVFAGLNRTAEAKLADPIPEEEAVPEEEELHVVKELEPERVEAEIASAEKAAAAAGVKETLAPVTMDTIDLEALLSETASNFAEQIAAGSYDSEEDPEAARAQSVEKEPETEESTEEAEEPETEESTEEAIEPETEESAEKAEEPETEESAEEAEPQENESVPAAEAIAINLAAAMEQRVNETLAAAAAQEEAVQETEEEPETEAVMELEEEPEVKAELNEPEEPQEPKAEDEADEELQAVLKSLAGMIEKEDGMIEKEEEAGEVSDEIPAADTLEAAPVYKPADQEKTTEEKHRELKEFFAEETPEERRIRILNNTTPDRLTEEQKRLFSYFAKVPGMNEQILDAIKGVYENSGDKTSKRGNIAIMGGHQTGKTRLSDGLVRAICHELGISATKFARIDASEFNRKEPARIVAKLSGGFLLIERAGLLNQAAIQQLSQAMEFRTDGLTLIIEDEKTSMRSLLSNNEEFAKKFSTVISIPVFTNDELVTFARTYAREMGYRMDEMGVLALYTLIGDNQSESEPITIGKVKEMVDSAIAKSSKRSRKLGRKMTGKHSDDDNRVILYEKDFTFKG